MQAAQVGGGHRCGTVVASLFACLALAGWCCGCAACAPLAEPGQPGAWRCASHSLHAVGATATVSRRARWERGVGCVMRRRAAGRQVPAAGLTKRLRAEGLCVDFWEETCTLVTNGVCRGVCGASAWRLLDAAA